MLEPASPQMPPDARQTPPRRQAPDNARHQHGRKQQAEGHMQRLQQFCAGVPRGSASHISARANSPITSRAVSQCSRMVGVS